MNQSQIEQHVGIDVDVAKFMMYSKTVQAKNAMNLLSIAVNRPESAVLAMLSEAVVECKKEMSRSNQNV